MHTEKGCAYLTLWKPSVCAAVSGACFRNCTQSIVIDQGHKRGGQFTGRVSGPQPCVPSPSLPCPSASPTPWPPLQQWCLGVNEQHRGHSFLRVICGETALAELPDIADLLRVMCRTCHALHGKTAICNARWQRQLTYKPSVDEQRTRNADTQRTSGVYSNC